MTIKKGKIKPKQIKKIHDKMDYLQEKMQQKVKEKEKKFDELEDKIENHIKDGSFYE